jgi:creatinine amidohydrolase
MSSVFYENLTPTDFRARLAAAPIAYVPLGTLEWHGEHLPLGSDGLQSRGFFERIANEIGGIVLPMLFLGPDRTRADGDGFLIGMDYADSTVPPRQLDGSAYWIDRETFGQMLDATVGQLARAGFRIIVAHGHGPSTIAFRDAIPALQAKHGVRCHHCWLTDGKDGLGLMIDHAATNETSLMMALHPDLVHMDLAPQDLTEVLAGVGGRDPRVHASAAHGEACLAAVRAPLIDALQTDLAALRAA